MSTTNQRQWTSKKHCTAIPAGGMYPISNHSPPDSASGISVKQYAIHQGVTVQAIYKRIAHGQLGDGVIHRNGRYLINPQRADAAWSKHGKPCNSRAAQVELRLMAIADDLAVELAGQSVEYCRAALWRTVDQVLNQTG